MGTKILLFISIIYGCLQNKSDVFFTKKISPSSIVSMFKKLNITLSGNVGLKVHTGEIGGLIF